MIELDRTNQFLSSLDTTAEYVQHRPISESEFDLLSEKLTKARVITALSGERQDYPRSLEYENYGYPVGYLKIHELRLDSDKSITFGINVLENRNSTKTDFFLHFFSPKGNIRFVGFINDGFFIRLSNKNDVIMLQSKERKLKNMNEYQYGIVSELIDNFITASDIKLPPTVK